MQMLSLCINRSVDINAKNLAGLTALEIIQDQSNQSTNKKHLRQMLLRGGALKADSLPNVPTYAESLKTKMSRREKWIMSDYRKRLFLSNEDRNIILLVLVLFATGNQQAAPASNTFGVQYSSNAIAPAPAPATDNYNSFLYHNFSFMATLASLLEIITHLPSNCRILRWLLLFLIFVYALSSLGDSVLTASITIAILLIYHRQMAVILNKFVPILVHKQSEKIKCSILKNFSRFLGELEE